MRQTRLGSHWSCPNLTLFKNVLVGKYGVVMNDDYYLSLRNGQFDYWYYMRDKSWRQDLWIAKDSAFQEPYKLPVIDLPAGRYIHGLHFFNFYVFGHLFDTLQSFKLVEDLGLNGTLLVNQDQPHIIDFDSHMSCFGYPKEKRLELDVLNNVYRVPELILPSFALQPNCFAYEFKDWLLSKYMSLPGLELDDEPRKLYLARYGNGRNVINQKAIIEEFTDLTPVWGTEPLLHQIKMFNSAKFIIGYHGSVFKNILFCKNNPKIVEFCSDQRIDRCFEEQSKELRISDDYEFIEIETDQRFFAFLDPEVIRNKINSFTSTL